MDEVEKMRVKAYKPVAERDPEKVQYPIVGRFSDPSINVRSYTCGAMIQAKQELEKILAEHPNLTTHSLTSPEAMHEAFGDAASFIFEQQRADMLSTSSIIGFIEMQAWLRTNAIRANYGGDLRTYNLEKISRMDLGPIAHGVVVAVTFAEGYRDIREYYTYPIEHPSPHDTENRILMVELAEDVWERFDQKSAKVVSIIRAGGDIQSEKTRKYLARSKLSPRVGPGNDYP